MTLVSIVSFRVELERAFTLSKTFSKIYGETISRTYMFFSENGFHRPCGGCVVMGSGKQAQASAV